MMFQQIESYMIKSRDERTSHIDLESECVELGGDSKDYRMLLAHHLKTMLPEGYKIHCCHACNNDKCSNPNHLYWGTAKENIQDQIISGTHRSKTYIVGSFKHNQQSKDLVSVANKGKQVLSEYYYDNRWND